MDLLSCIDEILRMESLQENWDGFGAIKPLQKCIDNAKSIILYLGEPFCKYINDIFPNTNGTISFTLRNYKTVIGLEIGLYDMSYYVITDKGASFVKNAHFSSDDYDKLGEYIH